MAVLEQVDELMNTGELAGIPSQVSLLRHHLGTIRHRLGETWKVDSHWREEMPVPLK